MEVFVIDTHIHSYTHTHTHTHTHTNTHTQTHTHTNTHTHKYTQTYTHTHTNTHTHTHKHIFTALTNILEITIKNCVGRILYVSRFSSIYVSLSYEIKAIVVIVILCLTKSFKGRLIQTIRQFDHATVNFYKLNRNIVNYNHIWIILNRKW